MAVNARGFECPDGLATDIVVFTITKEIQQTKAPSLPKRELKILLIKRGEGESERFPGYWALPGGFLQRNETPLACAARELLEETKVKAYEHLEEIGLFWKEGRDLGGWIPSDAFVAFVKEEYLANIEAGDDAAEAKLFTVEEAMQTRLAFDHNEIVAKAIERIKQKMMTTTIAKDFLDEEFTLSELQSVVQTVLPEIGELDVRNFRKKILQTSMWKSLIEEVHIDGKPKKTTRNSYAPAKLYRFTGENPVFTLY